MTRKTLAEAREQKAGRQEAAAARNEELPGEPSGDEPGRPRRFRRAAASRERRKLRRTLRGAGVPAGTTGALEIAALIMAHLPGVWILPAGLVQAGAVLVTSGSGACWALVSSHDASHAATVRRLSGVAAATLWLCAAVATWGIGGAAAGFEAALVTSPGVGALALTSHRWLRPPRRKAEPVAALEATPGHAELDEPEDVPPEVVKDPMQVRFEAAFCKGDFAEMQILDWTWLGLHGEAGLSFRIEFPHHSAGSVSAFSTPGHLMRMALLLQTIPGQITIDYLKEGHRALNPSETSGTVTWSRVVARTPERNRARDPRASTWNPQTGCIRVGSWPDPSKPALLRVLRLPGGGTVHTLVAGSSGTGKTGLCNLIMTQYGLMTADGRRMAALFVADTQGAVPHWKDHATVYGSKPMGALQAIRAYSAVMKSRDHWRQEAGYGWTAPDPDGWPICLLYVGELPQLFGDHGLEGDHVPEASGHLVHAALTVRKDCGALLLESQSTYVDSLASDPTLRNEMNEWNVAATRCARTTARQVGIRRDPADLPKGQYGLAFLSSADDSDEIMTVDYLPYAGEAEPGRPDAAECAAIVSGLPLDLGEPAARALADYGWDGRGTLQFGPEDCLTWDAAVAAAQVGRQGESQAGAPLAVTSGSDAIGRAVQLTTDLLITRNSVTIREVTAETGLDQAMAETAMLILNGNGMAVAAGEGTWVKPAAA